MLSFKIGFLPNFSTKNGDGYKFCHNCGVHLDKGAHKRNKS